MAEKQVKCPLCGFAPSRVYDIDEETASDQGNGRPTFVCMRAGCGLMIQVDSIEILRDLFSRLKK